MKQFGIVTRGITIALDGESTLDEACGDWSLAIDQASYDLLQEIQNRVKAIPIEVKWRDGSKAIRKKRASGISTGGQEEMMK